jgi:DNA-directed RNA polymerase specialized sigma24 family protein
VARHAARSWRLPGQDADDVRQECDIGLWAAARAWRPGQAPFPAFARLVIARRLAGRLKHATGPTQQALTQAYRDLEPHTGARGTEQEVEIRDTVRRLTLAVHRLNERERAAVARILDGAPLQGKADDNARHRARAKLRAAVDP